MRLQNRNKLWRGGGVAQRDCNFTDSAATGQRNCLGSFGSMIWLMSMNLKMQWAVYEWCCLYLFCRLIQATAATYLLQSLGKSLNSVILLLHSKKNDWGNSCTHTTCSFMIVLRSWLGKAFLLFLSAFIWLGFSLQHPTTHCWLFEQNTSQGFWSVCLFPSF